MVRHGGGGRTGQRRRRLAGQQLRSERSRHVQRPQLERAGTPEAGRAGTLSEAAAHTVVGQACGMIRPGREQRRGVPPCPEVYCGEQIGDEKITEPSIGIR